jgi:hypothetical protein
LRKDATAYRFCGSDLSGISVLARAKNVFSTMLHIQVGRINLYWQRAFQGFHPDSRLNTLVNAGV